MQVLAPKFKHIDIFESQMGDGGTRIETVDKKTGETLHGFNEYVGAKPMQLSEQYKAGVPLRSTSVMRSLMEQVDSSDLLKRVPLYEAATTSEFPSQLREDFKVIMLSGFNEVQDVLLPLFFTAQSTMQVETYAGINKLKKTPGEVREDSPYFVLGTTPKTDVEIRNRKRGGIVEITEEMIMFDKSGEIARLADALGRSVKYERYSLLTDVITTAGNTTAASSTVTLTPTNLENLLTTYMTQSDSASSMILDWSADTVIVPAALQWTARRILQSAGIPGSANNDLNVLKGIVNLVICPLLDSNSSTKFYIGQARNPNGLIYQNVIGPNPETFTQDARRQPQSDDSFFYDLIRYKSRLFYGQGIVDIRTWHRSTT